MDSMFNEIFTQVVNSEVAELTSLPEFIHLTQKDNPISNTPEFLKLLLTLENVIKTNAHIVRVPNLEVYENEEVSKELFVSSSKEGDTLLTHNCTDILDGTDVTKIQAVPNEETERAEKDLLDSDNVSTWTRHNGKTSQTIKDRLNKVFFDFFMNSGTVIMLANDVDETFTVVDYKRRGRYILYYNPLDSVLNVYNGTSCGSIFSFTRRSEYLNQNSLSIAQALLPGECIDVAGYAIYGCSTILTLGIRNGGVHQFTLDRNLGLFILTARDIHVPLKATSYTINESSSRKWGQVLEAFLSKKKREEIWANIASVMCGMGYLVNPHQCSEKWRNLKKTYIKIRDTIGKTGSRRNKWEYYYEMEGALEENTENTTVSTQDNSRTETAYNEEISDNLSVSTRENSDNGPGSTPECSKTVPVFVEVKPSTSQVSNQENYNSEPISTQENSESFKLLSLEHSTDPLQTSNSATNFTTEVHHLKGPTSPPDSPIPPFQTYRKDNCEENCLKRKLPPTEWYDKYLEELRAARHDKNKRHQDKQNFRQQLLDLCKQMLMSPTNNTIKTEISS